MIPPDLRNVAICQRRLIITMAAIFLFSMVVTFPGMRFGGGVAGVILLAVVLGTMAVILTLRLLRAMGGTMLAQVVVAALLFVPWVSLVTLMMVNHKATLLLRRHGIDVGFMGVRGRDLNYFKE